MPELWTDAACPNIPLEQLGPWQLMTGKVTGILAGRAGNISQFGFVLLTQQEKNSYFRVANQPICQGSSSRLSSCPPITGVGQGVPHFSHHSPPARLHSRETMHR